MEVSTARAMSVLARTFVKFFRRRESDIPERCYFLWSVSEDVSRNVFSEPRGSLREESGEDLVMSRRVVVRSSILLYVILPFHSPITPIRG